MGEEAKATCGILSDIIIGKSMSNTPNRSKRIDDWEWSFSLSLPIIRTFYYIIKFSKKW